MFLNLILLPSLCVPTRQSLKLKACCNSALWFLLIHKSGGPIFFNTSRCSSREKTSNKMVNVREVRRLTKLYQFQGLCIKWDEGMSCSLMGIAPCRNSKHCRHFGRNLLLPYVKIVGISVEYAVSFRVNSGGVSLSDRNVGNFFHSGTALLHSEDERITTNVGGRRRGTFQSTSPTFAWNDRD